MDPYDLSDISSYSYPENPRRPSINYLKGLLENKMFSEVCENLDLNYYTFFFVLKSQRLSFERSIHNGHRNDDFVLRRFKLINDTYNIVLSTERANILSRQLRLKIRNKEDEISISYPTKVFEPSKLVVPTLQNSLYCVYYYIYKTRSKSINRLLFSKRRSRRRSVHSSSGSNSSNSNQDNNEDGEDDDHNGVNFNQDNYYGDDLDRDNQDNNNNNNNSNNNSDNNTYSSAICA